MSLIFLPLSADLISGGRRPGVDHVRTCEARLDQPSHPQAIRVRRGSSARGRQALRSTEAPTARRREPL